VRQAGISVCAGGIIGLGEGRLDRIGLLHQARPAAAALRCLRCGSLLPASARAAWDPRALPPTHPHPPTHTHPLPPHMRPLPPAPPQLATLPAHPESVPINALVAIKGTPMEGNETPTGTDLARCVATARVLMPRTVVRLSAGRLSLSLADQVRAGRVACVGVVGGWRPAQPGPGRPGAGRACGVGAAGGWRAGGRGRGGSSC
jgi:hypothetical protein